MEDLPLAADTIGMLFEGTEFPKDRRDIRVGGTDDEHANGETGRERNVSLLHKTFDALTIRGGHTGSRSLKEDKELSTSREDRPALLKGWKLESVEEYAKRIGKDVKVVRAEMLRDFEEYLANKANNPPSGYQLPIVFRPPSPVSHPQESQVTVTKAKQHSVEHRRAVESVEHYYDHASTSDDESLELEYYELVSPEKEQRDDTVADDGGRGRNPRSSIDHKQAISPLATPDFRYLADRNVSGGWAGASDLE
ncbi:hypothetical protein GLOTRDRAFT_133235 [Gloeophyllum trabeum ATCC 11539]|uniref:Uncharacterized protein n=1 Tax=Gloeophyllum trabeum (strain ATCC 11539 / FP-39264 / Madison 617) TaxID=670483 RepID=S7RAS6_GLOTA|nr:uncharacterized protein GLOTRDRAFT_133235 [Gloeophyllum trabeum ATCC 11539]EPQ51370.1 hypothetical protein GLOTRDRAFT_133235 [Gloeophyllum trabeum ATCC 11539]